MCTSCIMLPYRDNKTKYPPLVDKFDLDATNESQTAKKAILENVVTLELNREDMKFYQVQDEASPTKKKGGRKKKT